MGTVNVMAEGDLADPLLLELSEEAEDDHIYQEMVDAVCLDDKLQDLPRTHPLKQYKNLMHGMFIVDLPSGTLLCLKDGRVVVPMSARQRYLKLLHQNHMAGRTIVDTARRSFYWPGLKKEIHQNYNNCETCKEVYRKEPRGTHYWQCRL